MQRKEVARMYIDQGNKVSVCLKATNVCRSSYYYRSSNKSRGKRASEYTKKSDGTTVSNEYVVGEIKRLLEHEFVDYGYIKVSHWLRKRRGYLINKKKVYRLMKENKLLNVKRKIERQPRLWVQDLVPQPDGIFEHLEIDIKYIYIDGTRQNMMQLTVLDVKSRYVLGYVQGKRIGHRDVIALFEKIFSIIKFPSSYYIRCDNGSQFVAHQVRSFFNQRSGAKQEFTRPNTPEQNGHIEAFHSIIERTICQRFEFETEQDLKETMSRFIEFYNTDRIHSGIDYECPLFEIQKHRPHFEAVWVADYTGGNPLISHQTEGLPEGESAVGGQMTLIN